MEQSEKVIEITMDGEIKETDLMQNASTFLVSTDMAKKVEDTLTDIEDFIPSISSKSFYLKFKEVGEIKKAVFLGFTTIKKVDKELMAARFVAHQEINGTIRALNFLNSGTDFIEQCRSFQFGQAFQIEYLGEKAVKNGNMKEFFITPLFKAQ